MQQRDSGHGSPQRLLPDQRRIGKSNIRVPYQVQALQIVYYECAILTLMVVTGKSIHAFKCLRKIIISYWKQKHYVCVWSKAPNLMDRQESILATIKRQKIWFSRFTCHNNHKTNIREPLMKTGASRDLSAIVDQTTSNI